LYGDLNQRSAKRSAFRIPVSFRKNMEKRHKESSCGRAPSVRLVSVVPHYNDDSDDDDDDMKYQNGLYGCKCMIN